MQWLILASDPNWRRCSARAAVTSKRPTIRAVLHVEAAWRASVRQCSLTSQRRKRNSSSVPKARFAKSRLFHRTTETQVQGHKQLRSDYKKTMRQLTWTKWWITKKFKTEIESWKLNKNHDNVVSELFLSALENTKNSNLYHATPTFFYHLPNGSFFKIFRHHLGNTFKLRVFARFRYLGPKLFVVLVTLSKLRLSLVLFVLNCLLWSNLLHFKYFLHFYLKSCLILIACLESQSFC